MSPRHSLTPTPRPPPLVRPRTLLALMLLACAACTPSGPLEVSDARVRELIPGQDKTAAYFSVRNTGNDPVVIAGARSDQVRGIQMHTTIHDGSQVRMQRLSEVVVPAGETVRFEPGARHLMLFGVSGLGDHLDVVLETQRGEHIPVRFRTVGYADD